MHKIIMDILFCNRKGKMVMKKLIWCKVKQFLEILRCEDVDRESIVDTHELHIAKQNLQEKSEIYQRCIADIPEAEQEKIKDYVAALKEYSFEECQQAYLQGMVDCMLILSGAGILKPQKELGTALKELIHP